MPKRPSRENAKERKGSADLNDDDRKKKKGKVTKEKPEIIVHLESSTKPSDSDSEDSEDSDFVPTQEEFIEAILQFVNEKPEVEKSPGKKSGGRKKREKFLEPALHLTRKELMYFNNLPRERKLELNGYMEKLKSFTAENEIPLKFRILELPLSEYTKSNILKKIEAIEEESNDSYKLKNWIDGFLKIPFGKHIPLNIKYTDGKEACSSFLKESRSTLNKAVYGMNTAKTQIMQVLAQWITNPDSIGNVIALHGPAGVGKTSIAKYGIAQALHRPFQFFSLGGASDIATYVGHSYTYEGSMWGRVIDSVMQSGCMNPVLYFDELDKISGTPHGEEVASMLIHLTDRTQNSQFHDRYFAGIDIDMSQCLFVFSFNDINQVNPILRDRMQVIHCGGYSELEKQTILKDYIWPGLLERLKFKTEEIDLNESARKFLITEYSSKEEGVRNLIRSAETLITRLNMLRIADEETLKDYKFYIPVTFPLKLTETIIRKLLSDLQTKEPDAWKTMFN
jgi:ATP-dependent Lon protease